MLPPIADTDPATLRDRPRVAERYRGYFVDPVEAKNEFPEPHWAYERTALLVGPWKAVDVDLDGPDRLERLGESIAPPAVDGRIELEKPEQLSEMLQQLAELKGSWPRAEDPAPEDIPNLSEETLRQLRALGYLD